MGKFLSHDRFGGPQVIAIALLLAFALQCIWLLGRGIRPVEADSGELFRVEEGLTQLRGNAIAGTASAPMARMEAGITAPAEIENNEGYDPNHSPLSYLIAAAPLASWNAHGKEVSFSTRFWGWLSRVPYILFGLLLGASLWYVSRRLYGNQGGYIALTLYCFSPGILRESTLWFAEPEIGAAWAAFGSIFTAIAVAHTLYAPREVVWWNWRRILLLGLSLALAIGSQFSLVVLVPIALGFMLYLAPARRGAALAIWAAAAVFGLFLLYAAYAFHPNAFWQGVRHASFFDFSGSAFTVATSYRALFANLAQASPVLLVALLASAVIYAVWPRTRYFGNTAPLMVAVCFLLLGLASPHYPGLGFQLMAVPFLFVFVAGIAADLLETPERKAVLACIWALLAVGAIWNIWALARIAPS